MTETTGPLTSKPRTTKIGGRLLSEFSNEELSRIMLDQSNTSWWHTEDLAMEFLRRVVSYHEASVYCPSDLTPEAAEQALTFVVARCWDR